MNSAKNTLQKMKKNCEVISGVNLPMVIEAVFKRDTMEVTELADDLVRDRKPRELQNLHLN